MSSGRAGDLHADYAGAHFNGRVGFGQKPALLIVDFVCAYTAPESPLYAPPVLLAISQTVRLLSLCRVHGVPVIFTRVAYHSGLVDAGLFVRKAGALSLMVEGSPLTRIVPELTPNQGEYVITKQYASAFFGTTLSSTLRSLGADTVLLAGCTTSGCIRATAVDGMQHGFHMIVPRECVGDRHPDPHASNLFDIDAKYGDVMALDEVFDTLVELEVD